jgi:hypothetical protein
MGEELLGFSPCQGHLECAWFRKSYFGRPGAREIQRFQRADRGLEFGFAWIDRAPRLGLLLP